ncbi:MAG: cold shock protein [Actinomycetota bacterium]|nr:cold shock protein [Actinomycetota bacterium]
MVNLTQGKVISFDQVKGYGFVSPFGGGEDVFLHVNDLLDEKHLLKPGVIVEFITEQGDRGPKASSTHIVSAPSGAPHSGPTRRNPVPVVEGVDAPETTDPDNEYIDVLPAADFSREVTEALLLIEPGLTGPQISAVRKRMIDLGSKYGWIGN